MILAAIVRRRTVGGSPALGAVLEQIGAIAQSLLERTFLAPFANLFVVSAEQHFWHIPTAERWRTCVMRIIQNAVIRGQRFAGTGGAVRVAERGSLYFRRGPLAEGLVQCGVFVAERAGNQAGHRV